MTNRELSWLLVMTSFPAVRTPSFDQVTTGGGEACEGEEENRPVTVLACEFVQVMWPDGTLLDSSRRFTVKPRWRQSVLPARTTIWFFSFPWRSNLGATECEEEQNGK